MDKLLRGSPLVVGANPTSLTKFYSEVAQLVVQAVVTRKVVGSSPTLGAIHGVLVQLAEPPAHNRSVTGSSPVLPTTL